MGDVTKVPHAYEITIRGVASDLIRAEFEDVELWAITGATCLRTGRVDQATLYGLIGRIENLGLVLLAVEEIDDEGPDAAAPG